MSAASLLLSFRSLWLVLFLALLPLAACAPSHGIAVLASAQPAAVTAGKVCYLVPHGYRVSRDSPDFRQYAGYVAKALEQKGFQVTDDINKADWAVALTYGMSAPQVVSYTGSRAVYGYRPAEPGQPSYTPRHQQIYTVTGYEPATYASVYYMARLGLSARELNPSPQGSIPGERVWDVDVTDSTPRDSLREAFTYMLAAAMEHVGVNTGQIVDVTLRSGDARVKAVRALMDNAGGVKE